MADFSSVHIISGDMRSAEQILIFFQRIYKLSGKVVDILTRYDTDVAFKIEADHLFTPEQIAEIGVMIGDVQTLKTNWEANHSDALTQYIPINVE
jgi:hypothetical protein